MFTIVTAEASDLDQHLSEQYQGKTFVIRGFYSGDRLSYDATGSVMGTPTAGDWTEDGFVQVTSIRTEHETLVIEANRVVVVSAERILQMRLAEDKTPGKEKEFIPLEIRADLGDQNPPLERAVAAVEKIFLTTNDNLTSLVPDYWKPCVARGLVGRYQNCRFSPELLAIPGLTGQKISGVASCGSSDSGRHDLPNRERGQPSTGCLRPRATVQSASPGGKISGRGNNRVDSRQRRCADPHTYPESAWIRLGRSGCARRRKLEIQASRKGWAAGIRADCCRG